MPIPGSTSSTAVPPPRSGTVVYIAALGLVIALAATGALALDHLGVFSPPGCGGKSPCRAAVSSVWGRIPGLDWPVSFIGAAYFAAMLFAWMASSGSPSPSVRWLWRLGAIGSLFYIGVMLVAKLPCPYCLTSHAANLAFVGIAEASTRRGPRLPFARGLAAALGVFAAASVVLAFAEGQVQKKTESEFNASTREMIAKSKAPTPPSPQPAATGATTPTITPQLPTTPIVLPTLFTGRYRWGPEVAPIRIVMFTGYQCPDCKTIDPQIQELLAKRPDISISIKHFPFCADCNRHVTQTLHPNACWAARAAEAAGILKGTDGFRKMHEWLFARGGAFTGPDLNAALLQFGWDVTSFIQTMQSPTTLRNVQTDAEEAVSYGLRFSPMIFINGVELKGWNAPDSVKRAVEALTASNPEARGPDADRPVKAGDKFVADWREQPAMAWPTRANLPALGVPNAPIKVTIYGDLLEPNTAEADRSIRQQMAGRNDMWYEFRYFPVDQSCNPTLPTTLFPQGCRAAKAAEAANALGGAVAYWKMHEWIIANQKTFSDASLRAAATGMGLNADDLFKQMDDTALGSLVAMDANIGMRLQIKEIPRISVNGKHIPRWNLPDQFVLERIIDEAGVVEPPK